LDDDVGLLGEAAQRAGPGGSPPVERDAALARVVEPEEEAPLRTGDALPEGRHGARRVAAGRLDLHHVGAEPGEELPGERAAHARQTEDAQTGQAPRTRRAHRRTKSSRAASSASVETEVTASLSGRSASTELGPTSIRTEKSEKPSRAFSAAKRAAHSGA